MYFFKSKHFENLDLWNIKNSTSYSKNIEKLIDLSNKKKIKKILIFLIHLIRKQLCVVIFFPLPRSNNLSLELFNPCTVKSSAK